MTIKARITLGMAAIVVLLVLVGAAGFVAVKNLATNLHTINVASQHSNSAKVAELKLLEANIAALKYRITFDDEHSDNVARTLGELKSLINSLKTADLPSSETALLGPVGVEVELYETTFALAADLTRSSVNSTKASARLGATVFREFSDVLYAARSEGMFMQIITLEVVVNEIEALNNALSGFSVTGSQADKTKVQNSLIKLENGVTDAIKSFAKTDYKDQIEATADKVSRLSELAEGVVENTEEASYLFEDLDIIGPRIFDQVEKFAKRLELRNERIDTQGQENAILIETLVGAMTLVGALIGIALSLIIARNLSRSILELTNQMTDMADGHLDQEIPEGSVRTEIGRMTNALIVFQASAREVQKLTEDMASMEELEAERKQAEVQREKLREEEVKAERARALAAEQDLARARAFEAFQEDLERALGAAREGRFDQRVDPDQPEDGLGRLAIDINELLSSIEKNILEVSAAVNALADGQINAKLTGEKQGAFADLQTDFNAATDRFALTISDIADSTRNVSSTANELEDASRRMARSSEKNAGQLQEAASTVEEMSTSLGQVVTNAQEATRATLRAKASAEANREVADATEAAMEGMTKASERIRSTVGLIEDIAFQVNLLALNAGVEAARAGEAGRGFAVVASEVRALAQRSQDAVQEINDVMEENARSVQNGVEQVDRAKDALEGIIKDVVTTTDQITEITGAVEQQSMGINGINNTLQSIEQAAQTNAAAIEELSASGTALNEEARNLGKSMDRFNSGHSVDDDIETDPKAA